MTNNPENNPNLEGTTDGYTEAPRGTDGTAYGRVIDADAYYNAAVAGDEYKDEAAPAPDVSMPNAVVDDSPVLEGVGPQYAAADNETKGVDLSTLPAFKDMRRILPSERLKIQMNTAKVAAGLPSHLKDADAKKGLSFDDMTAEDLDALTNVIATVEAAVLDNAADREAMTEWLVNQDNPLNAVMAAFTKFTNRLGN